MANKMINELDAGQITSPGDLFVIQTLDGDTQKLFFANLAGAIFSKVRAGNNNIGLNITGASDGVYLYISGTDTTYTNGAGLALTNGAFSVKLGENLSINAETGNIDASGGGSVWYFGSAAPESPNEGDYWLRNDSGHYGEVDSYDGSAWSQVGTFAGQDGAAATIAVGTVTTGAAGTNASVTNSGTSSAAVLDFTIPQGANGTNGTNGNDGYSISAATSAITGGHRVTISSTDPNVSDTSFDVMDGVTTIQTTSVNSTATLTVAGWTGAFAPYTQTVSVSGMTASIIPIIGLSVSSTASTGVEQQKQWAYVTKAESGAGTITFSCYETKPTVDLTVNIKAV